MGRVILAIVYTRETTQRQAYGGKVDLNSTVLICILPGRAGRGVASSKRGTGEKEGWGGGRVRLLRTLGFRFVYM